MWARYTSIWKTFAQQKRKRKTKTKAHTKKDRLTKQIWACVGHGPAQSTNAAVHRPRMSVRVAP
jgi:hypothetical protein